MLIDLYKDCQICIIAFLNITSYMRLKRTCKYFNNLDITCLNKTVLLSNNQTVVMISTFLGEFHRSNEPAQISVEFGPGQILGQNTDPVTVEIYNIHNETWCMYGKKHREGGPSIIEKTILHMMIRNHGIQTCFIIKKKWHYRGCLHRDNDRPAVISIIRGPFDGRLTKWKDIAHNKKKSIRKKWYHMGELHREKGPAVMTSAGVREHYFKGDPIENIRRLFDNSFRRV